MPALDPLSVPQPAATPPAPVEHRSWRPVEPRPPEPWPATHWYAEFSAAVAGPDGATLLTLTRHLRLPVADADADDEVLISAAGEIDMASVHLLRTTLLDAVAVRPRVCCDLSAVTYIGAAGLTALIVAAELAGVRACQLSLRTGNGPVSRVLRLAGLHGSFTIRR